MFVGTGVLTKFFFALKLVVNFKRIKSIYLAFSTLAPMYFTKLFEGARYIFTTVSGTIRVQNIIHHICK